MSYEVGKNAKKHDIFMLKCLDNIKKVCRFTWWERGVQPPPAPKHNNKSHEKHTKTANSHAF